MQINTSFKSAIGEVDIHVDTKRLDYKLNKAQMLLNEQVVADCEPLIPLNQGALRDSVRYPEGIYGHLIEWNTPYAHYQYEGILYLTEDGRSWANREESKYPTDRLLEYHHPGTGAKWFETAKEEHKDHWIRLVKETVGD